MLDQVKKSISELPNISFEEYFQNYVLSLEDSILYSNMIQISKQNKTLDDILKGDNVIPLVEGHIKKINVSVNEYIENLKPIEFEESNDDLIKNKVVLYTYDIDKEINVGEHLEELDLKKLQKRNSTIICNTDCILGVIIKKDYISCLKVTQTKFHKNDINFLLSIHI